MFVRRSLGLAAVEACARGAYRCPAQAVGPVADDAVAAWQESGWRTYHWEPWLAWQPAPARAVVIAEAVRWATGLWCAFDWAALGTEVRIGGIDEQWVSPPHGGVRLRGRVDLRVPVSMATGIAATSTAGPPLAGPRADHAVPSPEALVVTAGGVPPATWDTDLAFPALVSLLHRPRRPAPCRVMGIWPDAGVQHTVEIDLRLLDRVARRVVSAATTMSRPGDSSGYPEAPPADPAPRSARATLPSGFPAAVSGISSTTSSSRGTL